MGALLGPIGKLFLFPQQVTEHWKELVRKLQCGPASVSTWCSLNESTEADERTKLESVAGGQALSQTQMGIVPLP